ncbi:MAG: tryptophan--tRNA ligase [Candidatus Paceibacterota bacterium]|jgi:tryptophanyl-tRNA synthetase
MKTKAVPITEISEIRRILCPPNLDRSELLASRRQGSPELKVEQEVRAMKSVTFHCGKCKVNTCGIENDPGASVRHCPGCNSILMLCPVCHKATSGTEKFKILICDSCHTEFVTDTTVQSLIDMDRKSRQVVLSGIRATNRLHLGNFLGAIRQFVQYSTGDNLCLYFIADWHTLTTCQDAATVTGNSVEIAMNYIAAGLDPERSIIYAQSSVPEIAELALYLSMIQDKGELEVLPTLKDLLRGGANMNLGHLSYPVLMAADILGPKATLVPVGSDQIPNVELARRLAKKFNRRFGQTFVIPEIGEQKVKIPGLGGGKMAKSDESSCIFIDDAAEVVAKKYAKHGVTDKNKVKRDDSGVPENCASIYPVYQVLLGEESSLLQEVANGCRVGSRTCQECKAELAKMVNSILEPVRVKRRELGGKREFVREVLHFGGLKAREIIRPTLELVREKLGIIAP